ncbi:hypothetical protein I0D68_05760 [Pseudomonas lalucatii]|nr:hypothetical protein I0D68_05760 [Pseudomonas lalucatii]
MQALLARGALGTVFGEVAVLRTLFFTAVPELSEQRLWVEARQGEGVGGEQAEDQGDGELAFHDGSSCWRTMTVEGHARGCRAPQEVERLDSAHRLA